MKNEFHHPKRKNRYSNRFVVGEQFSHWIITDSNVVVGSYGVSYIKAVCECGVEKHVQCTHLIKGVSNSCGHDRRIYKKGFEHPCWTGPLGSIFQDIKYGARQRGISFELSKEYLLELYEKQAGRCAITNCELILRKKHPNHRGTASLDRIDSSEPYVEGNVHWVHKDINKMKSTFSLESFLKWCEKVTQHNSLMR